MVAADIGCYRLLPRPPQRLAVPSARSLVNGLFHLTEDLHTTAKLNVLVTIQPGSAKMVGPYDCRIKWRRCLAMVND